MSKIDLDPITSGYNLSKINANFQKVEDELNNKVLYRNPPAGEPNSMSSNLDMNSKSILNANKISSNILELGGVQVVPTNFTTDPYNGTREALRRSYAEAGYNLVNGSFEAGGTLVNTNDVLLQESTGKAFSGPAGTVAAGTNPASGGFVNRSQSLLRAAVMLNSEDIDQLGADVSEINSELLMLQKAQDWGKVAMDSKVANDSRILVYRGSTFSRVFVLINHYLNRYQRWELTAGGGAGDGFDNAVPTNPNGNMWMVNRVDFVVAGPVTSVLGSNPAMIRSGSTTIFENDVRISSGYVETTVFGESVYLVYVARADGGIANIYIDGALHSTLDQYNPSAAGVITLVKLADALDNANHTVRVETSGTKNPLSSSTVIRVREITGVGLTDFTNPAAIELYSEPLPSGAQSFKIGNAAMELAIETVVNGSTVFSGAYHKYCYPRAANGHKLYIDGVATDFGSMAVGEILVATDLQMVQDLILSNVNTPIADVKMAHHFKSTGCNVKMNITWTYPAQVNRSYQAMWPSTADRAILGGLQGQYRAYKSGSYINADQPYHNALAYHSIDGWVSGFYSNNEYGMRFTSSNPDYKGMYIWDRSTDFKIYLRKSSGVVTVGEKWNSDVTYTIGYCPDAAVKFDFDFLN